MKTCQSSNRYMHLDIVKFILVLSFMLAHFFPHHLGATIYWNTAGFVLMSGYMTGMLLPTKPLSFSYGTVKFLKINLWLSIYILSIYSMYAIAGRAGDAYATITPYTSVLEYIALFYLLVPFIGIKKCHRLMAPVVFLVILSANYIAFNMSQNASTTFIIKLLFIGGQSPFCYYPILGFINIGILGFIFSTIEEEIPFRKYVMSLFMISSLAVYYFNENTLISIWTGRQPPLLFYIIFSLSVFSVLLDLSRLINRSLSNLLIIKLVSNTAKYSIIIFVLHHPIFIILKYLNIKALMSGSYFTDLAESIIIVITINIVLCYSIGKFIKRLPKKLLKVIF